MRFNRYFQLAASLTLIGLFSVAAILLFSLLSQNEGKSIFIPIITGIVAGLLFSAGFAVYKNFTIPRSFVVSLLGQPQSGKTVFLSVLFDQMLRIDNAEVSYRQYGTETHDAVAKVLDGLSRGVWPEPTSSTDYTPHRATASVRVGLLPQVIKIEINDFPGEKVGELFDFSKYTIYSLHKSSFFRDAVASDAVILAIDGRILLKGDDRTIERYQTQLLAAMQTLMTEKKVSPNKKMRTPVAMVIMKSDLLEQHVQKHLIKGVDKQITNDELYKAIVSLTAENMSRLVDFCKRNCKNFRIFAVSSVGHVDTNNLPPAKLDPKFICNPLNWIIERVFSEGL